MWLKIKVWTKVVIASAILIYGLVFIFQNSAKPVSFWYWFGREQPASVFTLSTLAFVVGMIAAVMISTTWKTMSQIRELRRRNQQEKAARELADLKSKASMLKTRDNIATGLTTPSIAVSPSATSTLDEPAI